MQLKPKFYITGLLFFIALLSDTSCQQKANQEISISEAKSLLENAAKALTGDVALIDYVWTDDYVCHDPLFPQGIRGLDSMKKEIEYGLKIFTKQELKFSNLFVRGDSIFAFFNWSTTVNDHLDLLGVGTIMTSGKKSSYYGFYMGRIVNDKLAEDEGSFIIHWICI